jgi:hypothetical protein
MPRPHATSAKELHRRASVPGILGDILRQRWEEFRYPGFSPFALEIVCFDLRIRREHELSLIFARQPGPIQDAIDRELCRQYRPGAERNGILVQTINGQPLPAARAAARGQFAMFRGHIHFSETLAPCIHARWQEAGYATFSDYVTGLIRYDLLLLGPHIYYNGDDTDPEILASLDRATAAEFHENRQPKRIFLDRLLDEAAGRPLTVEERRAAIHGVGESIIERALAADRAAKRA